MYHCQGIQSFYTTILNLFYIYAWGAQEWYVLPISLLKCQVLLRHQLLLSVPFISLQTHYHHYVIQVPPLRLFLSSLVTSLEKCPHWDVWLNDLFFMFFFSVILFISSLFFLTCQNFKILPLAFGRGNSSSWESLGCYSLWQ